MVGRRIAIAVATLLAAGAILSVVRRIRATSALGDSTDRYATGSHGDDAYDTADEESYVTLRSLDEARSMEHTAVVMQGKNGEQIYLTVPVAHVACDEPTLRLLLTAIDASAWNEPARAMLSFELAPVGSGFYGGMGGGSIVDGVWMHERLQNSGLLAPVTDVIYGRQTFDEIRADVGRRLR